MLSSGGIQIKHEVYVVIDNDLGEKQMGYIALLSAFFTKKDSFTNAKVALIRPNYTDTIKSMYQNRI